MSRHRFDHHPPCPGRCGELADECMTPGCGSPLGSMTIEPRIGSRVAPDLDVQLLGHRFDEWPETT